VTARAFLVRGLLVGLLAGFGAFGVAYFVAEPHVQAAIDLEEAADHSHGDAAEANHHDDGGAVVSRHNQRTWGLLTGTLGIGTALGGLTALVSAAAVGRLGRLRPGQSTALVALVGWVAVTLVPFLKYPATPPAVGSADTIGGRTASYFAFLVVSVAAAAAAVYLGQRVWAAAGGYAAVVAGAGTYLGLMVLGGLAMPTVNEVGDFPADLLWDFRRASLVTTAAMWAVIGVGLSWAVDRLYRQTGLDAARRAMVAGR
jgi:predicted cobalt transporter CbtA